MIEQGDFIQLTNGENIVAQFPCLENCYDFPPPLRIAIFGHYWKRADFVTRIPDDTGVLEKHVHIVRGVRYEYDEDQEDAQLIDPYESPLAGLAVRYH